MISFPFSIRVLPVYFALFVALFLSSTGCSSSHCYISARIYPYGRKDLASYNMDTPDPLKVTQKATQIIAIDWKLPAYSLNQPAATYAIQVFLRLLDGSEKEELIPISSLYGKTIIELTRDEYVNTKGIASYKILLLENGKKIAESRHKLWEDNIIIQE